MATTLPRSISRSIRLKPLLMSRYWGQKAPARPLYAAIWLCTLAALGCQNTCAPIYKRIIDVLRPCADETLELALKLVTKLAMAEQAEESEAEESKKAERWLKKEEAQQIGPPSS